MSLIGYQQYGDFLSDDLLGNVAYNIVLFKTIDIYVLCI